MPHVPGHRKPVEFPPSGMEQFASRGFVTPSPEQFPIIDVLGMGGQTTPSIVGEPGAPQLPAIDFSELGSGFTESLRISLQRLTPNIGPGRGWAAEAERETRQPFETPSEAIGSLLNLFGTVTGLTRPPLTTEKAGGLLETLGAIEPVTGGIGRFASRLWSATQARTVSAFEKNLAKTITAASDRPVVRKLVDVVASLEPLRQELTAEQRIARGLRIQRFQETVVAEAEAGLFTPETFRRATGQLGGKLAEGAGMRSKFTPVEVDELMRIAWRHDSEAYAQLNNTKALVELLEGTLPQPAQLQRLSDIFGSDIIESFVRSQKAGTWDTAVDILGLPRAFVSSFDLSAPLRQGWLLVAAHPKEAIPAMRAMMKAFVSEKAFGQIEASIRSHRFFELSEASGLERTFRGGRGLVKASAREEAYMSGLIEAIPGMRMSERAYVGFLNKMRSDVFYKVASDWEGMGKTAFDYEELANFINIASGRGNLGNLSGKTAEVLNIMFFSPRFLVSRPQFIFQGVQNILDPNRATSKLWARSTIAAFGSSMTILGMMKLAGAEVELDPRSAEFGKGRIGNTRFDFFGGFLPLFRYIAQAITETRISGTGQERIFEREDVLKRFIQSKLSPGFGLGVDFVVGETFRGQEFPGTEASTITEQIYERLAPMFLQDLIDAIEQEGPIGTLMAAPGVLGVGIQSYEQPIDVMNDIAREMGQTAGVTLADGTPITNYDEAPIRTQDEIDHDPRVIAAREESERGRKPFLNPDEELWVGLDAHARRVTELEQGSDREVGLRQLLDSGVEREHLRNAIQKYLGAKVNSWEGNIRPQLEQIMRERTTDLLDIFRTRYWSVDAPVDLESGVPDLDARDEEQQRILAEAEQRGLDRSDVTFRRTLADPVVDTVVRAYFEAQEFLRPYFDITKNLMIKRGFEDVYREYRRTPQSLQSTLLIRLMVEGRLSSADRLLFILTLSQGTEFRRNVRKNGDPEIERQLLRYGWITTPLNDAVIEEEAERRGDIIREAVGTAP